MCFHKTITHLQIQYVLHNKDAACMKYFTFILMSPILKVFPSGATRVLPAPARALSSLGRTCGGPQINNLSHLKGCLILQETYR